MAETSRPISGCRDCGQPTKSRRGYCAVCRPFHCLSCDTRVIPRHRWKRCAACNQAYYQRRWGKERQCCCGGRIPAGYQSANCASCNKSTYELKRRALLQCPDRTCAACGTLLPVGRFQIRCAACKPVRPRQACSLCRTALARKHSSYCRPCSTMLEAWRTAYHAGDPAARTLRAKREYHYWQKKEAPP